jgi:hypothetical protein
MPSNPSISGHKMALCGPHHSHLARCAGVACWRRGYYSEPIGNHSDMGGNEEKARAIIAAFKFLEPFLT